MEVKYTTADGRMTFTFDVKDQMSAWQEIAAVQEIFEDPNVIINKIEVPSSDIRYRVRRVDKYEFYEKVYAGKNKDLWGYRKAYSPALENKGYMYPERRDKEKNWLPNDGWVKWEKPDNKTETN